MVRLEGRGWTAARIAGWAAVALLIAAPAVAMRYTDEVVWTASDFVFAAVLLGGTGLAIELLMRVSDDAAYRIGAAMGTVSLLFLVWANLAVGIVGSENDPFNLLYFAVLPIAAFGALVSRLRARGMAITFGAAAAVPLALMVTALMLGKHRQPLDSIGEVVAVNLLLALLFGLSAAFFAVARPSPRPA